MVIRFLPAYVGSKKHWIKKLKKYDNRDIVELFCGSSILSANLAKTAVLNDKDEYIYKILKNFDKLIVPKIFTKDDYFNVRPLDDWWKYTYCLQKMSFSGVFRYSSNGYNVPIKKTLDKVEVYQDYMIALKRWKELNPIILNKSYTDVSIKLLKNKVIILDPPYEGSQASYNMKFDYQEYWKFVKNIKNICETLIIFDRASNIKNQGIPIYDVRTMTVNGKYNSDIEAIAIYENNKWIINE